MSWCHAWIHWGGKIGFWWPTSISLTVHFKGKGPDQRFLNTMNADLFYENTYWVDSNPSRFMAVEADTQNFPKRMLSLAVLSASLASSLAFLLPTCSLSYWLLCVLNLTSRRPMHSTHSRATS